MVPHLVTYTKNGRSYSEGFLTWDEAVKFAVDLLSADGQVQQLSIM